MKLQARGGVMPKTGIQDPPRILEEVQRYPTEKGEQFDFTVFIHFGEY